MALANIVDHRKRNYCSFPIRVVIEPSCADNIVAGADYYDPDDPNITTNYAEMTDTSLYLAINWANKFKFPVTLYLYDFGLDEEQDVELQTFANQLFSTCETDN